ncbi:MAG TPA: rRNA adenine N-6-methyltransferase family protein [Candidatus Binatia bacterium]|nr:rRNA adenine N-6-methyltransferase family protein [Candidatus Binatia bacterium]
MTDINDQHFLTDEKVIRRMVQEARVKPTDIVLDIGAGSGAITRRIPLCKSIIAVEKDTALAAQLKTLPNVTVLEADAMRVPLTANKIISNLPFSILDSITYHLFRTDFEIAVLLVPITFAEKLQAGEIILSLLANAFFTMEVKDEVEPVPDTKMCILVVRKKVAESTRDFFIQQLFLQRDKKVKNALRETYVRWKKATKREGEAYASSLGLSDTLLATEVPHLTFDDYETILAAVEKA